MSYSQLRKHPMHAMHANSYAIYFLACIQVEARSVNVLDLTGLEAMMALYEFRLLDAGGKLSKTKMHECPTIQEAINVGLTFAAQFDFVEIWFDGTVIGRMPRR